MGNAVEVNQIVKNWKGVHGCSWEWLLDSVTFKCELPDTLSDVIKGGKRRRPRLVLIHVCIDICTLHAVVR